MTLTSVALAAGIFVLGATGGSGGIAELALDRGTVSALVAAGLPPPRALVAPGFGAITLRVEGPTELDFADGGIVIAARIEVAEIGAEWTLRARYEPRTEPLEGLALLVPVSAQTDPPLPFGFDLSGWLGSVELPRRLDWDVGPDGARRIAVACFVQGVRVTDERLVVELSLRVRPARP
jgi:hypothetical protein